MEAPFGIDEDKLGVDSDEFNIPAEETEIFEANDDAVIEPAE